MAKNPEEMKSGRTEIPVVMSWIGEHRLCLSKEDAAQRRPRNSSAIPVSIEWLEDPTRHLLKVKAVNARANRDDPSPDAETDQKLRRQKTDTPCAE